MSEVTPVKGKPVLNAAAATTNPRTSVGSGKPATATTLQDTLTFARQRVHAFFTISSKQELVSRAITVLVALCTLAILIVVIVEIGGLVSQRINAALDSKQDYSLEVLAESLDALDKLPATAPTSGYAKMSADQLLEYKTYIGPNYNDERALFAKYVQAIRDRRYHVLNGQTQNLFANVSSVKSMMGGIAYGPDWWDVAQMSVDIAGSIYFTGNSIDATMYNRSYADMLTFLGLDASNPQLTGAMIDKLLPKSAVQKRQQAASLVYKLYSTDPQKLVSFSLRVSQDGWIRNLSAPDIKAQATCRILETPTITWFNDPFTGGWWCPNDVTPSSGYTARYVNGTVGKWVIECDTPALEMTLNVIRWHALMGKRYSTAFYSTLVKLTGPRKLLFSEKMLSNMTGYSAGASYPIQSIVSMISSGTIEALPSSIYVVTTDLLPERIRTALLGLTLATILYTRCSWVGIRSLFHFILESPVAILLDVVYAVLTYPSGTELMATIMTASFANQSNVFVDLCILLRPYMTPGLIFAKAVMSFQFGFQQIIHCITVKESVVLILIGIAVLKHKATNVVGVGMKTGTTSDEMTSFVWSFHGIMWGVTIAFIFVRFLVGKALYELLGRIGANSNNNNNNNKQGYAPETPKRASGTDQQPTAAARRPGTLLPAYDEYLSGKFLAFGVVFLPLATVKGRLCRVLDGGLLWMDAVFNFNMNGLVQYNNVLGANTVTLVSGVGKYQSSDIAFDGDYPTDTGNVVIG